MSEQNKSSRSGTRQEKLTVEASDNRLFEHPLLHNDLDVRVLARNRLDAVTEDISQGFGRGPGFAELED